MKIKMTAAFVIGLASANVMAQNFAPIDVNAASPAPGPVVAPSPAPGMVTPPMAGNPSAPAPGMTAQTQTASPAQLPISEASAPAHRKNLPRVPLPRARGGAPAKGGSVFAQPPASLPEDDLSLTPNGKTERVIFDRRPVSVVMAVGREKMVHLPWESAIELPPNSDLDIKVIGQTAFIRSDKPIQKTRVVAQGMNGEGYIPLDITVRRSAATPDELEVFLKGTAAESTKAKTHASSEDEDDEDESAPDMVDMSRFCLQQVYAPIRLVHPLPGVRQVDINVTPVAGLYRGGSVQTTPIGAWRSTELYVTAVRLTNRGAQPIELDMEQLRGHWLAATPQHWRLLQNGNEADTTVACLISEQPFDASR